MTQDAALHEIYELCKLWNKSRKKLSERLPNTTGEYISRAELLIKEIKRLAEAGLATLP